MARIGRSKKYWLKWYFLVIIRIILYEVSMKTICPDSTKKEAPILGRDFIYNLYTFLNLFGKAKADGPALTLETQVTLGATYVN